MEIIDFNKINEFWGFAEHEDILVDTGVLLAYINSFDTWYGTITKLFIKFVTDNPKRIFLYTNPCIINEVAHLSDMRKSIKNYLSKHPQMFLSQPMIDTLENNTILTLKSLIEDELLIPLEASKDTYIKQLQLYKKLGSADAFNVSLANEYRVNFLTLDYKLVNNMKKESADLPNINKVYYTTQNYRMY